ncbi:MAG TPA: type III-B CRISPR module-associated Cmr3 family protein [Kofleriaceae bacterium]
MTITAHLAFYSRDGFFCKDGRGWYGAAGGAGHGLEWPWPSTVHGAVRTLWGRAHEAIIVQQGWLAATASIALGPTLAMWRGRGAGVLERRWPVPADVEYVRPSDSTPIHVRYLHPVPSPVATLGRDDDPTRERLWIAPAIDRGKPGPRPRWWTEAELIAWLAGSPVSAEPAVAADRPARRRVTRAAIVPTTQTVVDGALFSHDVVETVEPDGEWAIAAEITLPDARFATTATLGSDRRLARVEAIERAAFAPPPALATASAAGSLGLRLLVVTPMIFAGGWLPDGLVAHGDEYRGHLAGIAPEVVLRAAITPRPVAISGWDVAADAPRATNLAVAPGSVYFLQRADGGRFTAADVRGLWLAPLGRRTTDGFGRVVAAPWTTASLSPS